MFAGNRPHDSSIEYIIEEEVAHGDYLHVLRRMPQGLFLNTIAYAGLHGWIRIGKTNTFRNCQHAWRCQAKVLIVSVLRTVEANRTLMVRRDSFWPRPPQGCGPGSGGE